MPTKPNDERLEQPMSDAKLLEAIRHLDKNAGDIRGWPPSIKTLLEQRRFPLSRLEEAEKELKREKRDHKLTIDTFRMQERIWDQKFADLRDRMIDVVKEIEWVDRGDHHACPGCGNWKEPHGVHDPECPIRKLLDMGAARQPGDELHESLQELTEEIEFILQEAGLKMTRDTRVKVERARALLPTKPEEGSDGRI